MTEKIIEVKNLTKKYKELTAVNHLSFDVEKGEIVGLLGPNGSGKSTTINCILSLLSFNEGEIKIFGKEMKRTNKLMANERFFCRLSVILDL